LSPSTAGRTLNQEAISFVVKLPDEEKWILLDKLSAGGGATVE